MKRMTLIIALLLGLYGSVYAQSQASALFLLIAPGAAAGGTGEARVAAADDAFASYWNPATLAFLPDMELGLQYSNWLPGLATDMAYMFMGGRYNVPNVGAFGGHLIYLNLGEQQARGPNNEDLGTFISYMAAGTVSFGTMLSPRSSVGFSAKIIYQNLSPFTTGAELGKGGKGQATSFAFDLAYYQREILFPRLDFGLAVTNIGPKIAFIDVEQADPAPTNMKMGIKLRIIDQQYNKLALLYDMNRLLVASYPNIDHDGNGRIGGYDQEGNYLGPGDGQFGANGRREYAHTDPWYLALFTSWWDEWFYGGDRDLDGNLKIDSSRVGDNPPEIGNQREGSFAREFDTFIHNIGLEYWYSTYFAVRVGFIYDKLGKIWNPTFGAGIHYLGYGFDFGYIYGEQGHPLTNTMRFSFNMAF